MRRWYLATWVTTDLLRFWPPSLGGLDDFVLKEARIALGEEARALSSIHVRQPEWGRRPPTTDSVRLVAYGTD